MDLKAIESRLVNTFVTAFGCDYDPQKITAMKYKEELAWDSFGHMSLMTQISIDFSLELSFDEMVSLLSFQDCLKFLAEDH